MTNELFQYPHARAIADHVRVHGELEQCAFVVRRIALAAKNLVHRARQRAGPDRLAAALPEIGRVIAHSLDRQFHGFRALRIFASQGRLHDAAWLAIEQQFVAILVGHQRGVAA